MSTIESRVNGRLAFKAKGAPETGSKSFSPASNDDSAHQEFIKRRDLLVQIGRKHPEVRLIALVHLNLRNEKLRPPAIYSKATRSSSSRRGSIRARPPKPCRSASSTARPASTWPS